VSFRDSDSGTLQEVFMPRKKQCSRCILALVTLVYSLNLAVNVQAQTVTTLASFNGPNGSGPFASVAQATDGNFYGTTTEGGPYGSAAYGVLYRITPAGNLTVIYNFCSQPNCADGWDPTSVPILGQDGNLYGVTAQGGSTAAGSAGSGTIYKMTLGGKITTLYSFCATLPCTDGQSPTGLVQASDGTFYGTTSVVPNSNGGFGGTVFSLSPKGNFKLLYSFCSLANCADGDFPFYPPILDNDGNLYGATFTGGNEGGGLLWEVTSSGTYKVLRNFCHKSGTCGSQGPYVILRDPKGNFFGMTQYGSSHLSAGAVFEFTSEGHYHVLHNFDLNHSPTWPSVGLTLANDGNVYGVTGGSFDNAGSIFSVTPEGKFHTLYTFDHVGDGTLPVGPLFQGTESFYGTTTYSAEQGLVFRFSNGLSPLVEPVPTAGKVGKRVLILGNNLTGTTSVTFNGVPAEFTVEKDSFIRATVPAGATTGTVSVVTPSGTLNSNPQFVVTK
jgi:uncharacterized repeat protein (TIGR03803 family)